VEVFGELKMLLPKPLERKCKSKLIWTELTKIWQSDHNLVKVEGIVICENFDVDSTMILWPLCPKVFVLRTHRICTSM